LILIINILINYKYQNHTIHNLC